VIRKAPHTVVIESKNQTSATIWLQIVRKPKYPQRSAIRVTDQGLEHIQMASQVTSFSPALNALGFSLLEEKIVSSQTVMLRLLAESMVVICS
jgi:hypothetical protein